MRHYMNYHLSTSTCQSHSEISYQKVLCLFQSHLSKDLSPVNLTTSKEPVLACERVVDSLAHIYYLVRPGAKSTIQFTHTIDFLRCRSLYSLSFISIFPSLLLCISESHSVFIIYFVVILQFFSPVKCDCVQLLVKHIHYIPLISFFVFNFSLLSRCSAEK